MNKKGAIELSIGTIVIITLAISMLILGMILVRNIFSPLEFKITMDECFNEKVETVFCEQVEVDEIEYEVKKIVPISRYEMSSCLKIEQECFKENGLFTDDEINEFGQDCMDIYLGCVENKKIIKIIEKISKQDLTTEWLWGNCEVIELDCNEEYPIQQIDYTREDKFKFCCFHYQEIGKGICEKSLISKYQCGNYKVEVLK